MACVYKEICKEHKCKAKVFTQMPSNLQLTVQIVQTTVCPVNINNN